MLYLSGRGSTTWAGPCTSAAPFSTWHRTHGQRGFPKWVPWWVALRYGWQHWSWIDTEVRRIASEYGTPIER